MYNRIMSNSRTLATGLFQKLLDDDQFVAKIDESFTKIMADGELDISDTCEVVRMIVATVKAQPSIELTTDELGWLIQMLCSHFIRKYVNDPQKVNAANKLVDSAVALLLMQPDIRRAVSRCTSKFSWFFNCGRD